MKTRQVKMPVASQTAVLGLEWYCWEMEPSIQKILKICLKTARRIKWFCLSPHSALLDILFTIGITNSCTHWPVRSNMLSWAFLPQLPPFGTARSSDAAPARFFCLGKSWPAWPATYMLLLGAGGIYHSGGEKKTPPKPNQNIPSCCCSSSLPIVGSSTRRVISLLCSAASKFHVIPETVPVRSSMNYLCPSHSGEKKACGIAMESLIAKYWIICRPIVQVWECLGCKMQLIHFAKSVASLSDFVLMHMWDPKNQVRSLCRRRDRIFSDTWNVSLFLWALLWTGKGSQTAMGSANCLTIHTWSHFRCSGESYLAASCCSRKAQISHRSIVTSETSREMPWITQSISNGINYIHARHRNEPRWCLATASFVSFLL